MTPGRRLGFANLRYREATFGLELEVGSDAGVTARVTPGSLASVLVEGDDG